MAVGNITIDSATSGGEWGLDFSGSRVMQSTTGNVNITAVGNRGMNLSGSIVASTSATDTSSVTVPGTGGAITISATGRSWQGLEVAAGSLLANGSMSITGSATGAYIGVKLVGAGSTKAVGGITINASTTGANWAFYQYDSRLSQSTTGNIVITATATAGYGVYMYGGGLVAGNITTTPTSGGGITINSTSGANDIAGAALRMDANSTKIIAFGDISIYANGAAAGLNVANQQGHGVLLWGSSQVIRSYGGDLSMTGYATHADGSSSGWANISGGITLWNDTNTLRAYGGLTLKGVSMQGIGVFLTYTSASGGSVTADTGNVVIDGLSNSIYSGTYIRIPVVATAGSVSISGAGAGVAGISQDGHTGSVSASTDITMTGYNTSGGYGLQLTTGSVSSTNGTITFSGYTASTNTGHYGVYSTVNASAVNGSVNFQGSKMTSASTGSGYLVNAAAAMSGGSPNIPAPIFAVADSANPAFAVTNGISWSGSITANTTSGYIQINAKSPSITGAMTAYGLSLLGNNQSYTLNSASNSISSLVASIGTGSLTFTNSGVLNIGTYNGVTGITAASVTLSAGGLTDTNDAGITVTSSSTIAITNASGSYDYSGVIAGPIALTKSGAGTQTLSAANSYSGLTTISAGTLRLGTNGTSTNTPLGTTAAGTSITAGATLDLNGYTLGTSEALTLNGYGVSNNGALINSSASTLVTYSGAITVGSASYIGGAGTMTLSGAVGSASYGVGFIGAGSYTLSNTGNTLSTIATSGIGSLTLKNNAALTIGTVNAFSGMTFSGNALLDVTGNITMSGLTIQKNGSSDSTLSLKSSARVNLWHGSNQIKTDTAGGTGKLNMIFWSESDGGNTNGTSLAGTFTTNGGHIWAGGGSGSTTWNGLTVGNGAAGAGGDNTYAIDTQGTWTTTGGSIWLAGNVGTGAGYDLAIANGAAQVFNVGAGSVTLMGDYQYIGTTTLTSTGTLTIAPYGNAFTDGSGVSRPFTWSGSGTPNFVGTGSIANMTINSIASLSGLVIGKSTSTANANVTISNAISIAGPISIYGGNITVSGALTTTSGSSGTISLYSADSIMATASLTTTGADVLLTSNTDGTAGGSITLNNQTTSTSGGNITLGGGANGSGYAEGSVSSLNSVWAYRGIYLNNATVNSAAGNIDMRGKGWVGASYTTDNYSLGIDMVIGSVVRSTTGNISLTGLGGTNYKAANHSAGINFCDCGTAMSIYSVSGNVSLSGTAGTGTARAYAGINQDSGVTSIYSTSGNVTVTGIGSGVNDKGINIYSGTTFNVGTNVGNSIATSGNVVLQANNFNIVGALNIKNTGTVTLEPISSSFTSALSWPSNVNLISTTGLTLGKASNTADITIGAATSVAGPITIYGGAINVNAALTATGANTITLKASGDVVDGASGYVVASNLLMQGGNVTLDNAANNAVSTLAASDVSGFIFANKNALTIGAVGGTSGVTATGVVGISTYAGDLTFAQSVATSNTTSSAMVLTAASNTAAGSATGGNVVLSGSPSITTGTNGRLIVYTGSVADSTGITSLVGSGTGNFRYNSKPGASNFTTALGTSGNYAVYRQGVTATVTTDSQTVVYGDAITLTGTTTGLVNGDVASYTISLSLIHI
jgi:fibronectin-binding autotransporter adhesin